MKIITDIEKIEAHRRMASSVNAPTPESVRAVLRSDWDILPVKGRGEPAGIARVPHLALLHDADLAEAKLRPVLAPDMDAKALEAGFWRQLRVLPSLQAAPVGKPITAPSPSAPAGKPADAPAPDPYLPNPRLVGDGGRAWFLRRILGHDIGDVILYLLSIRDTDWTLFILLLAKDFKQAFKLYPDLLEHPWPPSARARWRVTRGRDRLPPVLVLVLLAELARLGCNHHALLALSFDADGRELYNAEFRDALAKLGGPAAGAPAPWLGAIADMAPLQSTALLPPDMVFEQRQASLGRAWSESAATVLTAGIEIYGQPLLDGISRSEDPATRAKLGAAIAFHPRFQPEIRQGHGSSLQKGNPVSYWTMNWRLHAVVGLIDLAIQARAWSAQYRTGRDCLKPWSDERADRPLERAIVAISYCFIETFSTKALATALTPVLEGKRRHDQRAAEAFGREIKAPIRTDLRLDTLAEGANFGSTICAAARARRALLPGPGEEGYTARYQAHLWLDARGDDIRHYRRHQRKAIKRHQALLRNGTALSRSLQDRFSADHRNLLAAPSPNGAMRNLPTMQADPNAVRAAQDYAMMMSPPATDPIRLVNLEPRRWRAPSE